MNVYTPCYTHHRHTVWQRYEFVGVLRDIQNPWNSSDTRHIRMTPVGWDRRTCWLHQQVLALVRFSPETNVYNCKECQQNQTDLDKSHFSMARAIFFKFWYSFLNLECLKLETSNFVHR